jgi:septal ring factor EnvC (AmiA/AmiB activator)
MAAKVISDCEELERKVEESVVEVAKVKTQLTQAHESIATLRNQLKVSEKKHAHTRKQLSKANGQVTERDQQKRNILAQLMMQTWPQLRGS